MLVQENGKIYLHNHLRFTILYHRDPETDLSRIVGFEVEPFSVKHKYDGKWNADRPELKTCNTNSVKFVNEKDPKQEVKEGEEVIFTYDVTFKVRNPSLTLHGCRLPRLGTDSIRLHPFLPGGKFWHAYITNICYSKATFDGRLGGTPTWS